MSWLKRNAQGGGNINPIAYVIALIIMPFVETARWCTDKTYSGFDGIFRCLIAFGFACWGAVAAYGFASSNWGLGFFGATPIGIAAWLAVMFYAFPLMWRGVGSPVWRLCDAIQDRFRTWAKNSAEKCFGGFVRGLGTILGAGSAWGQVLDKDFEDKWFPKLLAIVSYLSTLAGSCYLGWSTYTAVGAFVGIPVLGFVLSVAAGLFVAGIVGGFLVQLLRYGKLGFIATAGGVGAVWGAAPYIAAVTGIGGWAGYAVDAVAYVVFIAWVFPLANLILTSGFWAKVWEKVKPLPTKTYDDNDKQYAEFFHHVANFASTATVAYFAWAVAGMIGVPFAGAIALTAVITVLAYILGFKLVNHEGGNYIIGAVLSLAAAAFSFNWYHDAGFIYGVYGAFTAAVLALLVTGFLAFPAVYLVSRAVLRLVGAAALAKPLTALYNAFNEWMKEGVKRLRKVWNACYEDKTGYNELVLHVTNIAVAVGVFFGAGALAGVVGAGAVLSWVIVVLATALSYLLVGKLLFKSGYGIEFLGGVAGLYGAVTFGGIVWTVAGASWLVKVAAGVTFVGAWFGVFFVAFPVAYVVAKTLTSWALTGWLKPLLAGIYDFCWARFAGFWSMFEGAYKALKSLFAPLVAAVARAWAPIAAAYRSVLDAIRGRR